MPVEPRQPHVSLDGRRSVVQIEAETVRDALRAMIEWMEQNDATDCDAINISADSTGPGVIVFFYLDR